MRKIFSVLVFIAIGVFTFNNQATASVIKGSPVNYSIEIKNIFTNDQNQLVTDIIITENFRSDEDNSHPYAILTKRNLLVRPSSVTVDDKGNKIATFRIPKLNPGESIAIGEKLYFTGNTINYSLNSNKVNQDYSNISFASLYLSPSFHIQSDNPQIMETAKKVIGNETNPLLKAKKIYGFVNKYITYDAKEFSNKGALYALQNARGVCYEYSTLMVAMLRSAGVPARMVEGYKVEQKELNQLPRLSDGSINLSSAAHAWVEFYLPGIGWIPSEPTIYYTVNGRQHISWDYFTKIDSPLYIPINDDIMMVSKWSSRGHLAVQRIEALSVNPKDFGAPSTDPVVLPNPEPANQNVNQSNFNLNNLNIKSSLDWLNKNIAPLISTLFAQKISFLVLIAVSILLLLWIIF